MQNFTGSGAENEVEIGTELADETPAGRRTAQAMEDVLTTTFGQPNSGKLDFNNASQQALVDRLRDPLARAGVAMSEQQLQKLARDLLTYRDTPHASGLITDFNQLSSVPGVNAGIMNTLKQECLSGAVTTSMQVEMVGPRSARICGTRLCWRRCTRWPECWSTSRSGSSGSTAWPR